MWANSETLFSTAQRWDSGHVFNIATRQLTVAFKFSSTHGVSHVSRFALNSTGSLHLVTLRPRLSDWPSNPKPNQLERGEVFVPPAFQLRHSACCRSARNFFWARWMKNMAYFLFGWKTIKRHLLPGPEGYVPPGMKLHHSVVVTRGQYLSRFVITSTSVVQSGRSECGFW